MQAMAQTPRKVWTEAELQALPEDGFIHEVVNGELGQLVGPGGMLDGGSLLAGFQYPVADLFKEWDWE